GVVVAGLGSDRTAANANWLPVGSGRGSAVGLAGAGLDLALGPAGGKFGVRVKGANVTPGYWRDPEKSAAAFDEDGFYCMGDGVRLVDPGDPAQGLIFDGRLGEDFKLSTGTWVSVGALRARVMAHFAP